MIIAICKKDFINDHGKVRFFKGEKYIFNELLEPDEDCKYWALNCDKVHHRMSDKLLKEYFILL